MKAKISIWACLFIVVFAFSQLLISGTIIAESEEWDLHKYIVVQLNEAPWNDAQTDVGTLSSPNYHLATITSQAEQDFLRAFLNDINLSGAYWLGGYQDPSDTPIADANWKWVTGESWNYTSWQYGEPNDCYGSGTEQYMVTWSVIYWYWNDEASLGNIDGYIAELSPLTVQIDIKPGSDQNSINLGSKGVIPIAILGANGIDVYDVDQQTVVFEGNNAKEKGESGKFGDFEDVNSDGFTDLMLHFPVLDIDLSPDDTQGTLTGYLFDKTPITGTDAVRIVPPSKGKNISSRIVPNDYDLAPNSPNPFNPSTLITYSIPEGSNVILDIFNIRGEKITTLVNEWQEQGVHNIVWNANDEFDQSVPGGVYLCRMISAEYTRTIRMVLLK